MEFKDAWQLRDIVKEHLFAPWLERDLLSFVRGMQQSIEICTSKFPSQLTLGQSGVKSSKYHDLSQLTPLGGGDTL